jgi:uncharacterized protein RhaS with RHS repeats
VGKWLSQDPIGFTAGDSNLYRYVGNSPADGTDPLGEQFAPYGPGALPLKAYTAAVKKALKGAKRQIRDIGTCLST